MSSWETRLNSEASKRTECDEGVHRQTRGRGLLSIMFTVVVAAVFILPSAPLAVAVAPPASSPQDATVPLGTLDPLMIPKYVNQLTGPPPVWIPTEVRDAASGEAVEQNYSIEMTESVQQILPAPLPKTPIWCYAGEAMDSVSGEPLGYVKNSPAPSFEATKGVPINVEWINNISGPEMFAVDPTIHWADPNGMGMPMAPYPSFPPGFSDAQQPVPLVPHLHGGEVQSTSDGNPLAWFTYDGKHGPTYFTASSAPANAAIYHYPNSQPATTLWYHDHALGVTRINVMSGLAGFYLLRDPSDPIAPLLPSGKYDVPLAIQDRTFNSDGSFLFPSDGVNPDIHPYWSPEFFGNAIMVNGLAWPNMNVDQGQYMFRVLDGSNARFYTLSFSNGMRFTVVGTEGGYLKSPAIVNKLTIAPGERYVILADFSGLAPGTKVQLINTAKAPFPSGRPPQGSTTGRIMQFTVTRDVGPGAALLPPVLNPTLAGPFPSLPAPTKTRILTLYEDEGPEGPLGVYLNGQMWDAPISETPVVGSTEEWQIVDMTMDAHPIHLHLVQFQVVSRQKLDTRAYQEDWLSLNGEPPYMNTPKELSFISYLQGKPRPASPIEQGWKDTVQMYPGEVTIIRIRWAPIDGSQAYPFDATVGPGYVWHCHILDHEDNEMMRPYIVLASLAQTTRT